jgi:hypothetical protein
MRNDWSALKKVYKYDSVESLGRWKWEDGKMKMKLRNKPNAWHEDLEMFVMIFFA